MEKIDIKRIMSVITTYKFMHFIIILAVFLAITTNFACQEATDESTDSTISGLPPLTDTIPYEKLGQGKLVFERIGPLENNYSGIYVIDIYNQSSWGIGSGVFKSPAVSPNGQKIAYLLYHRDYNNEYTSLELIVMNADGSNPQSLANFEIENVTGLYGIHDVISLCWSPDGSKIAFNKKEEGHLVSHIYIINSDGSGLT